MLNRPVLSHKISPWITTVLLLIHLTQQAGIMWYIQPCRITTENNGTMTLCQKKSDCASQNTGTTVECSQYTYFTLATSDCITQCCPDLSPVPTAIQGTLIQTCYDQAKYRQALYVIKIVFIVSGIIGIFVFAIACYACAFVDNPYTGRRTYVGCLCCKKKADFQKDRNQQMKSLDQLEKDKQIASNVMLQNQKIVNKIET